MHNKTLVLTLLSIFTLLSSIPMVLAHNAPFPGTYDWTHLVVDAIGGPETTDPAWAYDTSSAEFITNVYETLFGFDRVYTKGPYRAGEDLSAITPVLASVVPTVANGGIKKTSTTLSVAANPGDSTINVGSSLGFSINNYVKIGNEIRQITGIPSASQLTLDTQLRVVHGIGTAVTRVNIPNAAPPATTLSVAANPGDSTINVGSSLGFVIGDYVKIGNEIRQITGIPSASQLTLDTQLRVAHGIGTAVDRVLVLEKKSVWIVPIRPGVQFHTGAALTPADAEYSIERVLVQDRADGPQWMLYEPLMGLYSASSPLEDRDFGIKINSAVESDGTNVIFNLGNEYPELAFKQIIAQSWSSIMSEAWAVAEGDFDGDWTPIGGNNTARWELIWNTWHNPSVSFIEDAIGKPSGHDGGTGPYEYDYWTVDVARSVVKNDGGAADPNPGGPGRPPDPHADLTPATTYWDGWPARVRPGGATRIGGSLERVTWRDVPSWPSRLADALAGTADYFGTPRNFRDQVLGQSVGGELIRAYWRAPPNAIAALSCSGWFLTLNASSSTIYYGNTNPAHLYGSDPLAWGNDRAPLDVWSDVNARLGVAYAFDYADFISTTQLNEASQPSDPIVPGLAYDNVQQQKYSKDLVKAEYYLRLAWGGVDNAPLGAPWGPEDVSGTLWTQGLALQSVWNTGNVAREYASNNIVNTLNNLNPGVFNLVSTGLTWGTVLLPAMAAQELGVFQIGWLADYADPHDFAFPYMHTEGTFSYSEAYSNPVVDALVVAGIQTSDDGTPYDNSLEAANGLANLDNKPAGNWQTWPTTSAYYVANPLDLNYSRRAIYYALQEIWYEEAASVSYVQGLIRAFEQAWVRGWYYNALSPGLYVRDWYKAKTHFGDTNWDGAVNILDVSTLSSSWTGPPQGAAYFLPQADITGGIGGTTGSNEGGVKGLPNGKVEIDDLSLLSGYWDGPPQGPSHP